MPINKRVVEKPHAKSKCPQCHVTAFYPYDVNGHVDGFIILSHVSDTCNTKWGEFKDKVETKD